MMGLSGNLVTLDNGGMLSLEEIATGLSRMPRFAGQTVFHPWSVAHHSLVCERMAQYFIEKGGPTWWTGELMLHALLHDAHEAMTGDIPTSFKTSDTKLMQRGLDSRIYAALGVAMPTANQKNGVTAIDQEALLAEARVVTPPATYRRICIERSSEAIPCYVEMVRDVLMDTEDAALTYQQHVESALRVWGAQRRAA